MTLGNDTARLTEALAGRYRVERPLGAGGAATVYAAEDLKHHRRVAIKVLHEDLAASVGAVRFLREIEIAAQLQHPNILPLLDSGEVPAGHPGRSEGPSVLYYVMPLVEGASLRDRLTQTAPMPITETIRLLIEIVDALGYAHDRGVVHRDVKPDNIMVSGRHALVADFGIARAVSRAATGNEVTSVGLALGTPAYMAPEQALADPDIDRRADIYAVGVVAYEMLTGRTPFSGGSPQQVLSAHLTARPEPVSAHRAEVSPALERVIMRCLAKQPTDRWQTADELLAALEPLATTSGATPGSERPSSLGGRTRTVAVLAGMVIVVAGAAAAWFAQNRTAPHIAMGALTHFTAEPGLEIQPSISPDGKSVAYAAGSATRMRVFIRPVDGARTVALVDDSTALQRAPRWSPDGTQLLVLSGGGVAVVPALGGRPTTVVAATPTSSVRSADWSPDGQSIAFVRGDTLFTTPVSAAEATRVGTSRDLHSCVWSPGGAWIACVSGNYLSVEPGALFGNIAPSAIVLFRSSGGPGVEITERKDASASPAWFRGEDQLYYVSTRDGPRDVYVQDLTRGGKPLGTASRVSTGLDVQSMTISRTGRFAYSVYASRANVWSIAIPTGAAVTSDAATPLTTGNQVVEGVKVAHDRRWLLYDSNIRGASQIFRVPLAGGSPEQLTNDSVPFFSGDLSPDGKLVTYHSWRTGSREIELRPIDGGPVQRLTSDGRQATSPAFSNDGRAIAYWEQVLPYRRRILRRDANGSWSASPATYPGWLPSWSPDDRLLVFIGPDSTVSVAPSDSGQGHRLYPTGPSDPKPESVEWSDDGRTLYFKTHDPAGRAAIWSIPSVGGSPRLLVRFADLNRPSSRPELAVGGGRLFFTLTERESDVWVSAATAPAAR